MRPMGSALPLMARRERSNALDPAETTSPAARPGDCDPAWMDGSQAVRPTRMNTPKPGDSRLCLFETPHLKIQFIGLTQAEPMFPGLRRPAPVEIERNRQVARWRPDDSKKNNKASTEVFAGATAGHIELSGPALPAGRQLPDQTPVFASQ